MNDAASSAAGSSQGTGGLAGVPRRWPQAGGNSFPGSHGVGYVCRRCGKAGHFLPNCPTNGDPSYDKQPPQKLMNTSTGSRKIVATLEGIETKNKTVIYCIKASNYRNFGFYLFVSQLDCFYLLNLHMDAIVTSSQIEIKFRNDWDLFKCCFTVNKNWGVYNTIGKSAIRRTVGNIRVLPIRADAARKRKVRRGWIVTSIKTFEKDELTSEWVQ